MLYCKRRSDGLGRTWTWSTAWLASTVYSKVDYTVLAQTHRTAMSQWVLMSSGFWNNGRAGDGQGKMVPGCHWVGCFTM